MKVLKKRQRGGQEELLVRTSKRSRPEWMPAGTVAAPARLAFRFRCGLEAGEPVAALSKMRDKYADTDLVPPDEAGDALSAAACSPSATPSHLRVVLSMGHVHIDALNDDSETALHACCAFNRREMVAFLLERGADIHKRTSLAQTPLHIAVANNQAEIVELLLSRGASLSALDNQRSSVVHIAASNPNVPVSMLRLLLAQAGARELLECPDIDGDLPLHLALTMRKGASDDLEVVACLLGAGADPNARNRSGNAALHLGVKRIDAVSLLLQHSADPNIGDKHGNTPLHLCVHGIYASAEIAEALLVEGANPLAVNDDNQTPRMLAFGSRMKRLLDTHIEAQRAAQPRPLHAGGSAAAAAAAAGERLESGGAAAAVGGDSDGEAGVPVRRKRRASAQTSGPSLRQLLGELDRAPPDSSAESDLALSVGKMMGEQRRWGEAINFYLRALKVEQTYMRTVVLASLHRCLCEAYSETNQHVLAIRHSRQHYDLAVQLRDITAQHRACSSIVNSFLEILQTLDYETDPNFWRNLCQAESEWQSAQKILGKIERYHLETQQHSDNTY
eukprot:TRINITY_DN7327_c1_g1_i2.p1 TRINITY_DN7327_c1_g1~~TRINITY_DN7327_c1_g1_i2.p1  ORF type:complete len:573 (+),score=136.56 TRINITY_DN7327_c1_g1_i2:35-1720(+)